MAFQRAVIEIKPASVGTGIKVSLRRSKKMAARMTLFISTAVARSLSIANGDRVDVLLGDDAQHGLLRMRKNNSVATAPAAVEKTTGRGAYFQLSLGHQPAFVDRTEASAWCQWEQVEDGWIEVVLPKWADETRPGRQVDALKPKPVAAPAGPIAPRRAKASVTGALMGDPEPGRREAVARIR